MLFNYLVVGSDGVEQKGKIEAISEEDAKKKLNDMGLSILSVESVGDEKKLEEVNENLKKYLFSGKDVENQEVEGEIEAHNEIMAYKRLVEEFQLEVFWLIDASLPKAVQESKKQASIQFITDLAYERGIKISGRLIQRKNEDLEVLYENEDFREKQKKVVETLDTIVKIFGILLPIISQIAPAIGIEMEKKLNALQKIRMSNNLVYIQESSDEIIQDILRFFEKHRKEKEQYKKDLLHLESLLTDATSAKLQKALSDLYAWGRKWHTLFLGKFQDQKANTEALDENHRALQQLELERREIIRLLGYHLWGLLVQVGELRRKHKDAFAKLFSQLRNVAQSIYQIKKLIQHMKEFYASDMSLWVFEVELFAIWIFIIYFCFFVLAEISIFKSKILPVHFIWQVLQSGLIMSTIFGMFLILFTSPFIQKYFSKNFPKMLLSYLSIFFLTLVFYLNY